MLQLPEVHRHNIDQFLKIAKGRRITHFLFEEEGQQKLQEFLKKDEKLIEQVQEASQCFPQNELNLICFVETDGEKETELHHGDFYTV